jgi:hypothetical protein
MVHMDGRNCLGQLKPQYFSAMWYGALFLKTEYYGQLVFMVPVSMRSRAGIVDRVVSINVANSIFAQWSRAVWVCVVEGPAQMPGCFVASRVTIDLTSRKRCLDCDDWMSCAHRWPRLLGRLQNQAHAMVGGWVSNLYTGPKHLLIEISP